MRTIYFVFAIIATIGFATPELSAQKPDQENSAGNRGPGQQAGGPGGRIGGGQRGAGMQRGGGQNGGGPGGGMQRRGGPGGGMGSRMMQRMPLYIALDKDKDGQLSKAEIRNAIKAIKTLDKNGDGLIDAEEMAPEMSQMRGGQSGRQGMGRGPGGMQSGGPNRGGNGGRGGRQGMGQRQGPGGMQGGGPMQGGMGGGKSEGGATRPKRPAMDDG